jgi:mono/diheme cytochrome c family protein
VYQKWCGDCHGSGPFQSGTAALQARFGGRLPAELEKRTDLTPEVIRFFVRRGANFMPPFRKTEISEEELEALASYLARKP